MSATGQTFAEMVDQAASVLGLNDYQLSAAIGLMPGNRVCSPKQVSRIRKGEQVNYRPELVERLVAVRKILERNLAGAELHGAVARAGLPKNYVPAVGRMRAAA